jgi:outer membrane lipoprotein-sorting protein
MILYYSCNCRSVRAVRFRAAVLCVLAMMFSPAAASAQEGREIELTAQEILARADRVLEYPRGLIKGKFMHIQPDGSSSVINLSGSITATDFLFRFSSGERGEQLKVLYNLGGEDIWVYNPHALKLFHKMEIDKYDQVLFTNFSYIDLSNADFQGNYTAALAGETSIKNQPAYRLRLEPIFKGGSYGRITMYVTRKDFIPLRIDYHDNDRVIFKSMSVVRTMSRENRIIPVRYDMLDIRRGTVTILEWFGFDETVVFDRKMFFHQNLSEGE